MDYVKLSADDFATLDPPLDDWRFVLASIQAEFKAGDFPHAAALVAAITEAAEEAAHHPDIDVRYPDVVRVTLTTHATGGLTTRDTELAATISGLARAAGATPNQGNQQVVELAIDTMDPGRIRGFWAAVLGYEDTGGYLVDPQRQGPPMWFQTMEEPREERSRFHVDVTVPHDVAEQRVAAATAAGGTLVSDEFARSWWVLADADGNEACVCTWQDR
ncbi:MAG: VOC family protein [Acidimicrobiales bacterium]